ncbi:SDR family NAD(P)-dependent oxidoreductase [Planococcus sp. ISL-109]|uniref:SDR family NAD(P)-dependent oxidoreductase n=1 Tax=Planococcus sp. ISL-109 TaxID=2819166 RepID=UPI001BE5EA03|nr:SDR family NAD(P)-dependent oxidoreductase [Planococcus sp. ISL-109]MBT2582089.1 SDR family NAD(P)-dependent oxidoreductase [Planococcus sp. ISL-109]
MEAYVITGASKGIGLALSKQLTQAGHQVIGIARSKPADWTGHVFITHNLIDMDRISGIMASAINEIPQDVTAITLVNNAGTIEPIGFAASAQPEELAASISLNLVAPMALSAAFLRETKPGRAKRRIVNISSGAGRKHIAGWSAYCTGKAGLDHYTACVDAEYPDVKAVSVAPGIIDTAMQETIRNSGEEDFPQLEHFRDYKRSGKLSSPEETAAGLIALMQRPDFEELPVVLDLRELPQ